MGCGVSSPAAVADGDVTKSPKPQHKPAGASHQAIKNNQVAPEPLTNPKASEPLTDPKTVQPAASPGGLGSGGVLVVDGKQTDVPDFTFTHTHDPYVATIQSWYKAQAGTPGGFKASQQDIDKAIKKHFKEVKKYNVDTNFSATNSIESHVDALKKKWAAWKKDNQELVQGVERAAEYTQIIIYAGLAKLLGADDNGQVSEQMFKYTEADPGWATTVLEKLEHPGKVLYRPAPTLDSYVYPLRSQAGSGSSMRIALVSDWATGTPQAFDLLNKLSKMNPDVTLHLGDVYYSGTPAEFDACIVAPVKEYLQGTQFYNVPGNHDYYSGGEGYLGAVDELRKEQFSKQEASFFCLEGDHWVIITLDTSLHDANPLETVAGAGITWLDESEAEWARDKVKKAKAAGKKVMLMSHHQWCTLCSTVGKQDGVDQALNPNLYRQLKDVIEDVDVWFWGHEHSLQLFEPYCGLKRGRLIGNGSVPVLTSADPYAPKPLAPPTAIGCSTLPVQVPGSPQMSLADFGYYYNNSFVMLTLEGAGCRVEYYDIPWLSAKLGEDCVWGEPRLTYTETF